MSDRDSIECPECGSDDIDLDGDDDLICLDCGCEFSFADLRLLSLGEDD